MFVKNLWNSLCLSPIPPSRTTYHPRVIFSQLRPIFILNFSIIDGSILKVYKLFFEEGINSH